MHHAIKNRTSYVKLQRFKNLRDKIYQVMNCGCCNKACIRAGLQKSGVQKYFCQHCKKYQQQVYKRKGWEFGIDERICSLLEEGVSMRGIARILEIALSTVIRKIKAIASHIMQPARWAKGHVYEIDELWT